MSIKLALAGNPNSGKTTLFNRLTGSTQYVGNWPGVTVEKKEGMLKSEPNVILQDLPGIYSLSPYTPEELITREYLVKERPDAIVNIVDASNIERNLYLTTQLIELGIPVIVALNMIDVVRKNGDNIDVARLSRGLRCPVLEISALKGLGEEALMKETVSLIKAGACSDPPCFYSGATEHALAHIEDMLCHVIEDDLHGEEHHHTHHHHTADGYLIQDIPVDELRWYAVKLFERDPHIIKEMALDDTTLARLEEIIQDCEKEQEEDAEAILIRERYNYIEKLVAECVIKKRSGRSRSEKVDMVLSNRWAALPIFALIMFLVYYLSIAGLGGWMADWTNEELFGRILPDALRGGLEYLQVTPWLISLIVDGILGGVGAVLGFLPQLVVLFLCLSLLEDCGYMSRVAFLLDRMFRRFGLSGKSFIPMLIGTGCSVPGIMASRTIENDKDRRMTVITTSFMPCGAKLPIIAMIAGALFHSSAWVAVSAYFVGASAILFSGLLLKKAKPFACNTLPFVMELPSYHLPATRNVLLQTWDRSKAFIKKAGTVILLASMLIWLFSSFNWRFAMVSADASMLASLGGWLAPLFTPLGWGNWQAVVATLAGLSAKEAIVGTLGVLYSVDNASGGQLWQNIAAAFTPASGYSFLLFNLLCTPCVAAIGTIRREMNSARWTWAALGYQTGLAYAVALVFYQLTQLFTGQDFSWASAIALLLVAAFLFGLFRKNKYACQYACSCNGKECRK